MNTFEFWFRKEYEPLIRSHELTQFVRPGVRLAPQPKGTKVGDEVSIRFLEKPGTANSKAILNSFTANAVVIKLEVKQIQEMEAADFEGTSPDAASITGIIAQLQRIYERPCSLHDTVTVFKIFYL